ncbi:MAG: phosphatase PAP2 family protein [Gammaproteobacteria bacterium]
MSSTRQIALYLTIPFMVIVFALLSEYSGMDLHFASSFYDEATGAWPYKSLFITSEVLHTWGRYFIVFCALSNLFAIIASFFNTTLAPWRKHLMYIFIAAMAGPLLVGLLKASTYIYTPWDLQFFGGDKPYIRIFDAVYDGAAIGHAFPGGHSSGGFAYISLFFALSVMRNRYRFYGLLLPLVTGIIFAVTQEIRGAHFLSHDLFSFAICWLVSFALAVVIYPDYWRPAESSR